MADRRTSLAPQQQKLLAYILTRHEYEQLSKHVEAAADRLGFRPLRLPLPSLSQRANAHELSDEAVISRESTRLFALVYAAAGVYEVLVALLRKKGLATALRAILSTSAMRLASFVASFSAIYRLLLPRLEQALSRTSNKLLRLPALPPFAAALFASPTMLLETRGQRRVTLTLYALTRALHAIVGVSEHKGLTPPEPKWWWGGHLVFAASNAVLLHSFVYDKVAFPSAYGSFIMRYSGAYLPSRPPTLGLRSPWPTSRQLVDAVTAASRSHYPAFATPLLHGANAYKTFASTEALRQVLPVLEHKAHPAHERLTCAILHPEERVCWKVFERFVLGEFVGASKFFGALSLIGMLTRWKKLMKRPEEAIYNATLSTLSSSAFLSLALGTAWGTICAFQHYLPGKVLPTKRFYLQGFLAGLWVLLVPASRRIDLGLYSLRIALQCAWDVAVSRGRARNIPGGELLYFSFAMGVLMSCHDRNPSFLQSRLVKASLRRIVTRALYESVSLTTGDKATQFQRTIQYSVGHAQMVKYLVVGQLDREQSPEEDGLPEASETLVEIIEACQKLTHLQVRCLYYRARSRLLAALELKQLTALVLGPPLTLLEPNWSTGLFLADDIEYASTVSDVLEIKLNCPTQSDEPGRISKTPNFVDLRLKTLSVVADLSDKSLCALLKALGAALASSAANFAEVSLISNPTQEQLDLIDTEDETAFDYIIKSCVSLRHLVVTATEISPRSFSRLPPLLETDSFPPFEEARSA
ncbi:hypothetical protein OIV83_001241 [Microbotryomycetes sp. JL201]|nr:hypothetical protein OIV83_001241 [Microbotryomycetes sp. JL201]